MLHSPIGTSISVHIAMSAVAKDHAQTRQISHVESGPPVDADADASNLKAGLAGQAATDA